MVENTVGSSTGSGSYSTHSSKESPVTYGIPGICSTDASTILPSLSKYIYLPRYFTYPATAFSYTLIVTDVGELMVTSILSMKGTSVMGLFLYFSFRYRELCPSSPVITRSSISSSV